MPSIDRDMLEKAAEKVFDRLNYFNDYTLQTIGRRIKNIGKLSAYDQQTLKNMADISGDMKAITKKLAEITGQSIEEIEKIYAQTVSDGVNSYKPLYDFKNMQFTSYKQNEFAQQLAKHWFRKTAGEMINLSRTKAIGFDKYNLKGEVIGHTPLAGAFQKAVDDAVIAVSTGTVDFNSAMRETIKNLGGSGVKVTYGSGVNLSLSAMVRQNLLYGVKQSALAYDDAVGEELGCDGFEVDAHAGCRPSHEFMQGQMYSYDGEKTIDGVTYQDGAKALARLKDYGCLHFKTNVILGVSSPRYSKEELDRIHKETTEPIEYDGKQKTLYEWKQAQRRIEREIRKESQIRDMAKASGDGTLVKNCNETINAYRQKYEDMCEKVGLTPKYERMSTYMGSYAKIVDNGGKSGIIKEKPINPPEPKYKRFDINDQKGYDDWVNAYYSKNKPNLTPSDIEALKTYTDGSYNAINASTRFEKGSEPYNKICRQYRESNLDKYKKISDDISNAIKKFELDDDIICHRYVSNADYITGTTSSSEDLAKSIGKEYVEKGFTSTCLFEHLTKKFGGNSPIHLEIRISKRTSGAYINDFSEKKNMEFEYLLDRGTRFKVIEGGERKIIENKWVTAERKWKDVEETEKYMILEVLK